MINLPVVFQSLSHVQIFVTPWIVACQASLSFTISESFLKLMSIELMMTSNHLVFCHPLLLLSSVFPSIRVFSNQSVLCIRWAKYWSFSFSISPSNGYSVLTSFRTDCFDFLAIQGTLKSLLQHHSSEASILQRSAFFTAQLSHPYLTTGKTIALTSWIFVDKAMSLLFNKRSRPGLRDGGPAPEAVGVGGPGQPRGQAMCGAGSEGTHTLQEPCSGAQASWKVLEIAGPDSCGEACQAHS